MKEKFTKNTAQKDILAFTLIELMVVLAVVVIIVAILFPVFASVREKGRQAACLSNLRQLHLAITQYAEDNNGYLPPYSNRLGRDAPPSTVWPDQSSELVSSMRHYTGSDEMWFCLSDPFARIGNAPLPVNATWVNHRFSSYMYAYFHYIPSPVYLRSIQARNPDSDVLFYENSWGCKANDSSIDWSLYSHNKMFNAVLFDGHVHSYQWNDDTCLGTAY